MTGPPRDVVVTVHVVKVAPVDDVTTARGARTEPLVRGGGVAGQFGEVEAALSLGGPPPPGLGRWCWLMLRVQEGESMPPRFLRGAGDFLGRPRSLLDVRGSDLLAPWGAPGPFLDAPPPSCWWWRRWWTLRPPWTSGADWRTS